MRSFLLVFPLQCEADWLACAEERYEAILKAYNVSVKGDTAAKRQALREFIGLTPPS